MRLLMLLASLCAVACLGASGSASGELRSCATHGYAYAGFASAQRSYGVSAQLTALSSPHVLDGHVAAWVGVGGRGEGPNRTDEWLQVGLSGFADDGSSKLYYELTLPGRAPQYVEVRSNVSAGESHRVTVLELQHRRSWWRIWVDHTAVTQPIHLPQSHRRWAPIATAESWDGGAAVCNAFAYRFGSVVAAAAPGGAWRTFVRGYRFQDPGYRVVTDSRNTFRALGD